MAEAEIEDAPPGHDAWRAVKKVGAEILAFEYHAAGAERIRVQLTFKAAGGTREETARILRLCYLRAEGGASKEELEAYKKTLLGNSGSSSPAVRGKAAASPNPSVVAVEAATLNRDSLLSNAVPQSATDGSTPSVPPACDASASSNDAPAAHPAWRAVKNMRVQGKQLASIMYQPKEPGAEKIRIQVTAQSAGNIEEACRICRLCFVKLEEGCSKQDVEAFKKRMCDSLLKSSRTGQQPRQTRNKRMVDPGFTFKKKKSNEPSNWRSLRRIRKLEDMSSEQLEHAAKHIAKQFMRREPDAFALWCSIGLNEHKKVAVGEKGS